MFVVEIHGIEMRVDSSGFLGEMGDGGRGLFGFGDGDGDGGCLLLVLRKVFRPARVVSLQSLFTM